MAQPLQLQLDDAELADLVRCLDRLRLDARVKLTWSFPEDLPLRRHEIAERIPLQERWASPVLAGLALTVSVLVAWFVPLPPANEPMIPNQTEAISPAEPTTGR